MVDYCKESGRKALPVGIASLPLHMAALILAFTQMDFVTASACIAKMTPSTSACGKCTKEQAAECKSSMKVPAMLETGSGIR
jgi:hypothetical protein